MKLLLAILAHYHAWRARGCSRAFRWHMERRQALMARARP
jgi:hypothetical protein